MNTKEQIAKINTADDVRQWIETTIRTYSLNFHPDTPFTDYVNYDNGTAAFTAEEAAALDIILDHCFEICRANGWDIYGLGIEAFNSIYPLN